MVTVIPAKAGNQSVAGFPTACRVDFRSRGNDRAREHPCLANDTLRCTSLKDRVRIVR